MLHKLALLGTVSCAAVLAAGSAWASDGCGRSAGHHSDSSAKHEARAYREDTGAQRMATGYVEDARWSREADWDWDRDAYMADAWYEADGWTFRRPIPMREVDAMRSWDNDPLHWRAGTWGAEVFAHDGRYMGRVAGYGEREHWARDGKGWVKDRGMVRGRWADRGGRCGWHRDHSWDNCGCRKRCCW